jgi:hypothetical protein
VCTDLHWHAIGTATVINPQRATVDRAEAICARVAASPEGKSERQEGGREQLVRVAPIDYE